MFYAVIRYKESITTRRNIFGARTNKARAGLRHKPWPWRMARWF